MSRLVKQVSIESPATIKQQLENCIFNYDTPMPEVPPQGARIKVKSLHCMEFEYE